MSLRSIPLRLKLVAALVLPMLVVAGYLALNVSSATADRAIAREQQSEVERFVAVAAFSDAIGVENFVIIDRDATELELAAARTETDAVLELLRSDGLALGDEQLANVTARYDELVAIRRLIGDRPFEIRLRAQSELREGDLTMTGEIIPALDALSSLPGDVLADFDFDATIADATTSQLLDDYFLVQRFRADLGRELSTLVRVASLPSNLVDSSVVERVGVAVRATDQSLDLLGDLGTNDLDEALQPLLDGPVLAEYQALREAVDAIPVQGDTTVDVEQLQVAQSRVDIAVTQIGDDVISDLDAGSADAVFQANRELVLSVLVGFWLLILVSLLLRVLYRAIKSPIERLTEQAEQISLIELPSVVDRMRRGEIETIPEIDEIDAESRDEIGDLVRAFNGMHRTAVELAAEQAASRRVVADMFVNLGRRNQRLVNRLLKGLTGLEQNEEDPDKLAALYDIDHVATRMRRNAESLLVLAGAGQSRHWDRPVSLYDISRASLAEVENYERVQIDVGEQFRIDGGTVADLTHLLAELVENALSFSPPNSPVELRSRAGADSLVLEIVDHGVGMTDEQMAAANANISQAANEDETPSEFLGHYVVGRLAARHGIDIRLVEGPVGGLVARVEIPARLVSTDDDHAGLGDRGVSTPTESIPAAPAPEPVVDPSPVETFSTERSQESVDGNQAPTPAASSLSEQAPRRRQPSAPVAPGPAATPEVAAAPEPARSAPVAAASPNPASFDFPSSLEIDPRSVESTPRSTTPSASPSPAADPHSHPIIGTAPTPAPSVAPTPTPAVAPAAAPTPPPAPVAPSLGGLDTTIALEKAADQAVDDALGVFGAPRRTPGAQLPTTDLFASISGSMRLGGTTEPAPAPAPAPSERPSVAAPTTPSAVSGDEDRVRSALSGFQQGTIRADREMGDHE